MPRARSRVVQRSARRSTVWLGFTDTDFTLIAANSQSGVVAVPEASLEEFPNPTLVRTRGQIDVKSSDTGAVNDDVRWTAGLAVMDAKQVAAGVTAFPFPGSDSNWDGWFWWSTGIVRQVMTPDFSEGLTYNRKVIDSKAMRKIGQDQVVACVIETQNAAGTNGILVSVSARFLFKK